MLIYLIRHPETSAPNKTCYGKTDFPLKAPVKDTSKIVLPHIPKNFPLILSSPLGRAHALAEDLAQNLEIRPVLETDPRLEEMNFGDWDGQAWESLPKKETMLWMSDFVNRRAPNGESFQDVIDRTSTWLNDWCQGGALRSYWEEKVGKLDCLPVVTHSGAIRAILCRLLNTPPNAAFENSIAFGSVREISI